MSELPIEQRLYQETVGCSNCGRFGLNIESMDSEHRREWVRAVCPYCSRSSASFPMRPVRSAKPAAA